MTKTSSLPELIDGGRTSNLATECYRADPREGVIAANYVLKNLKGKKIAVIDERSNYSNPLVEAFKATLNQGGVTEALTISVDPRAYDPSHEAAKQNAEKLKQAGVQVIYFGDTIRDLPYLFSNCGKFPLTRSSSAAMPYRTSITEPLLKRQLMAPYPPTLLAKR
ncbi:ABC transporter substrate-binding protein [Neorhizobium sp. P12A]|uniref:ABC transporter substrate-binding protein n=1 Tax=Neorhizobium sp. P12A TaxID=2268027 RepID=UPI00165E1038|nr:ABC transporter substrate-binding protein [Neorhizobium sp. P12A]